MQTNYTTEKMRKPARFTQEAQQGPAMGRRQAQEPRGRQWERTDKRAAVEFPGAFGARAPVWVH